MLRQSARLLARRGLCASAAQHHTLWVGYADNATMRQRLVRLAQSVRSRVPTEPAPDIVLPTGSRVRQGFFFLRFDEAEHRAATIAALHGQPFELADGSLTGQLHVDEGARPCDAGRCRAPRRGFPLLVRRCSLWRS